MNVGDYVRTKYGNIGKITNLNKQFSQVEYQDNQTRCDTNESNILKSSPNIIDLIEVGDYVNGYPVAKIYKSTNKDIGRVIEYETDNVGGYEYEAEDLWECHIKSISIVTKEQFESMEYKI